ncbi:triacylglycerol lipase [Nocardiopsis sp. Huas11]|uniref:esterase/lipase family protein n=1 Tax=Nocardiopsis sp. Huas11 TaxID=2183912 RepID=UPI000EAE4A75|nr:alpha/beta fold hydrolase [Nocardiopsis sp. Huas11]RKS08199.1 triacylglycerol lipase [Nocardiopsis sp. Huas11]
MRLSLAPAAALLLAGALTAPAAAHAQERDPVLFVHGYSGNATNWDPMIADFTADGWDRDDLHSISYDYDASNTETAELIAEEVDAILAESGGDAVDVVTHSMGGLSSRWYLKILGGHEHVDQWISLAGPNQGSSVRLPCVATAPSCQEVVEGSGFLQELNAGDPTPGDTAYTTFRSLCDLIVRPSTNVTLSGADNRLVGCVSHTAFLRDDGVSEDVRDVLS